MKLPPLPSRPYHGPDLSTDALEPYRIFFPSGVLFGLLGVSIWPIYGVGWISSISKFWHIDLMLQGFLFAFILGFLMTALPRFLGSESARPKELLLIAGLFIAGNLCTVFHFIFSGKVFFALTSIGLFDFGRRRFKTRRVNPPSEFVFVFVGIATTVIAATFRVIGTAFDSCVLFEIVGRRLLSEGAMVLFVLGVGGKLIPLFFGFTKQAGPLTKSENNRQVTRDYYLTAFLAFCFLATFPLEYCWHQSTALYVRACVVTFFIFKSIQSFRVPKTGGFLVAFLWVSLWMVLLSVWATALYLPLRVPGLHVMFIGGFSIMIICIATRVVLSHGGWPTELEKSSIHLLLGSVSLLLALAFRLLAPLYVEFYFHFLSVAGLLWIFGLLIWGITFSKRAICVKTSG